MSRRYPGPDEGWSRGRHERGYGDVEVDINRTRYADRPETVVSERRSARGAQVPEFLRDDYGRTNAGPLVVRDREPDGYDYPDTMSRRGGPPERVEKDELVIRERRGEPLPRERPPPSRDPRDVEREEVVIRRGERDRSRGPRPRDRDVEETDVIIRRGGGEPEPPRAPPPDIVFRRGNGERRRPRRAEVDEEELIYRHREETRSPPARSERGVERDEVIIRERDRSIPPPRRRSVGPVAREREEWLFRRREPSPPPPPREEREEIIIRRRERSPPREPSPEPVREPTLEPSPPPPQLEPIVRPPIIQEIITHHRHIDHGIERVHSPIRSPSPPPPPPSPPPPPKDESLEIEIKRRNTRNGYEENIMFEREVSRPREPERNVEITRSRSVSAPRRRYEDDISAEAEYYNRKALERGYPGEAYNGATRDWGLVDIPPGTRRVQMDGAGGGRQDITWQQYTGARRSKFYAEDDVYASDFGPGGPLPERKEEKRKVAKDMWTEVTKDLVSKEAIEEMGLGYEENEHFFYIMEYLQYEDVLQLVELSEDIRRERKARIQAIQYEREELERLPPPKPRSKYDEHIYERELVYDSKRSGRYR